MADEPNSLPRMMLGFVIRRCSVDLGHAPDANEFAAWANNHGTDGTRYCLFGRPISASEAQIILKRQSRLVSARSAAPHEQFVPEDEMKVPARAGSGTIVSLQEARMRSLRPSKTGRNGTRNT